MLRFSLLLHVVPGFKFLLHLLLPANFIFYLMLRFNWRLHLLCIALHLMPCRNLALAFHATLQLSLSPDATLQLALALVACSSLLLHPLLASTCFGTWCYASTFSCNFSHLMRRWQRAGSDLATSWHRKSKRLRTVRKNIWDSSPGKVVSLGFLPATLNKTGGVQNPLMEKYVRLPLEISHAKASKTAGRGGKNLLMHAWSSKNGCEAAPLG